MSFVKRANGPQRCKPTEDRKDRGTLDVVWSWAGEGRDKKRDGRAEELEAEGGYCLRVV